MSDIESSILFLIIGAVIGAIASYIVSYRLQLRKWRVEAALLRKNELYGPIFDELVIKERQHANYKNWSRISTIHRFVEWEKHRETSLGLLVPKKMKSELESLVQVIRSFNESVYGLNEKLKELFPDRNREINDWAVAREIADRILIAPDGSNNLVVGCLRERRPSLKEFEDYWTETRLRDVEGIVTKLDEFKSLRENYRKYSNSVSTVKLMVERRIEKIVKRYQTSL
jgi:hypothetical protein